MTMGLSMDICSREQRERRERTDERESTELGESSKDKISLFKILCEGYLNKANDCSLKRRKTKNQ